MCQFQCFILQIDITAAYRERPEYQENSIPAQEVIERKWNYCALGKSSDVIYIYIYIYKSITTPTLYQIVVIIENVLNTTPFSEHTSRYHYFLRHDVISTLLSILTWPLVDYTYK